MISVNLIYIRFFDKCTRNTTISSTTKKTTTNSQKLIEELLTYSKAIKQSRIGTSKFSILTDGNCSHVYAFNIQKLISYTHERDCVRMYEHEREKDR